MPNLYYLRTGRTWRDLKAVADVKAQFKRRTFHVPNRMQISLNKGFCSLTLHSAHEKFDVWAVPETKIPKLQ